MIDLISILPSMIAFFFPAINLSVLMTLRAARLLRLFKFQRHLNVFTVISTVLRKRAGVLFTSMAMIFLMMMVTAILMYNIERLAQPDKFNNIFSSFWWALSAIATIGYGDIYPITIPGQILNGIFSFFGIALVAIPTAVISAGFIDYFTKEKELSVREDEKHFCPYCGHNIERE